jgi:Lrp/AsnC family transcriptional regulator, leucine-responsive regulatory protein
MTEEFSAPQAQYRPLDQIDTILLTTLQEQGRLRLEDLARRVKLSPSTVHDRLRRLQRDGVIRNWTVTVNPQALNLTVLAFVGVRASRPCSELVEALALIHEIEEAHSVDGALSLIVKLRATNTEHLLRLIERLKRIPGVESTETTVALKTYIERGPRPAPEKRAR